MDSTKAHGQMKTRQQRLRDATVAPCTATTTARPVTLLALKGKPFQVPSLHRVKEGSRRLC
jgi:hypothetical protein